MFIQTYRAPRELLASWLSLAESVRALSADESVDAAGKAALGAEQLAFMSGMLNGAAALRSADRELDRRFAAVSYLDLVADPVRVAGEIYGEFGSQVDDAFAGCLEFARANKVRMS